MNSLEQKIQKQFSNTKKQTLFYLKQEAPFEYMMKLSKAGEKLYNIPVNDSFWYGVNKSLDWYNEHKKYSNNLSTEFYALKQGAEWILRYCYYNQKEEGHKK